MRTTIPVHFNHHLDRGGRLAFREWATGTDDPTFSPEPIFRYGRPFSDAVTELRRLGESQDDVFLCNIVGHSSVLTSRSDFDAKTDLGLHYEDIEDLIAAPRITGYLVDDDLLSDALAPLLGWHSICGGHSFDDSSQHAGLLAIATASGTSNDAEAILHCQLADPTKFASNWRHISFPIYFIPAAISFDFALVANRFRRDRLSSYLLRNSIPFATMGVCHMDDDIAVSYLVPAFNFPETLRCFIR